MVDEMEKVEITFKGITITIELAKDSTKDGGESVQKRPVHPPPSNKPFTVR
jgi:hypothetical protein